MSQTKSWNHTYERFAFEQVNEKQIELNTQCSLSFGFVDANTVLMHTRLYLRLTWMYK